jgi:hypothetical protein
VSIFAPRVGGGERLLAPGSSLKQGEQLGERAQSLCGDGLDLAFDDRVQAQLVHLPAALALGEELAP